MMKMKMLVVIITMTMMRMKMLVVVFGADPAEWVDPAEWADSAECCLLGRAGCKLLPPTCGDAGCGFGIGASSSLSKKKSAALE